MRDHTSRQDVNINNNERVRGTKLGHLCIALVDWIPNSLVEWTSWLIDCAKLLGQRSTDSFRRNLSLIVPAGWFRNTVDWFWRWFVEFPTDWFFGWVGLLIYESVHWMCGFVDWVYEFVDWLCETVRSKVNWFISWK